MAFFAYRDCRRTELIYAEDCNIQDRGIRFYCSNIECDAHLYIRSHNSILSTHFYAHKDYPHSLGCIATKNFNITKYSETDFNFETVINDILENIDIVNNSNKASCSKHNTNRNQISISRLGQLYGVCKSRKHTNEYNGYTIWNILFDCRCNYILTKGISGKHIIECKFYKYDSLKKQIFFKYPITESLPNKYILKFEFEDGNLFNKSLRMIFNTKNIPIAIAGDWKHEYRNVYHSYCKSGKQIYFPKL